MNDYETLVKNDISVLRLTAAEGTSLAKSRHKGMRFTWVFPHEIAHSAKKNSLVIIAVDSDQETNSDEDDDFDYDDDTDDFSPGLKAGFLKWGDSITASKRANTTKLYR